jgi:NAD(P)-dependent dehydrogenase (short-subunit alcohol dehydrogenase family)
MAKRKVRSLASVAGFMSPIDLAPYGVAKSRIIGLTRSMALELADCGITGCERTELT